ncbi:transcription termination factor Rho [Phycicoccus sp. Soil748]|nr:transcription termination factor Rho [Phycicoccus sp. Soil748]KRE55089.1 transcription termination factor Rho [Phycicoccus sp. Soil748]
MTDTTTLDTASSQDEKPRRSGALSTMKVAELQGLAASMGITGTAKMRKGDLVTAIKDRQSGGPAPRNDHGRSVATETATAPASQQQSTPSAEVAQADSAQAPSQAAPTQDGAPRARRERGERRERTQQQREERQQSREAAVERQQDDRQPTRDDRQQGERGDRNERGDRQQPERGDRQQPERGDRQGQRDQQGERNDRQGQRDQQGERNDRQQAERGDRQGQRDQQGERNDRQQPERTDRQQGQRDQQQDGQGGQGQNQGYGDDEDGRGGRRRNRNRNRNRDKRGRGREYGDYDNEPQVAEDDVLVPVAGILDVLENYAFVRTSGYLPGANDVYVPLGTVKKNGMRKGDAVTGAVKAHADDQQQNQRQKFNALVRLDTVNGMSPEEARKRVEFGKLTPLYPQQRLRLETDPHLLTTRVIDLVAPIGKGQRGLIVAPAKAGKTMVMQAIANAITTNNPECHLMVVLVDERPEEVTDMQRAVKGEVISSTFDRPAEDHTTVAELAIERAKRLVEMGHDVVVLLDSITKLGRAYNLAAPASGRILSGGVDSAALYPPKKFFGAARNIENGGSLTILATALVETGSRMDEVIFEEFKGTGNMELKLDRGLANRRIFPAVDINNSGTRKEEILLSGEELKIMWKLRRVLAALDQQQGIELLIDRLKKTRSNAEFLMQVQQNSSLRPGDDDHS